ncbi:VOC family protein [Polyangium aurulentum]|uniref:VOC family protein n=1 Tax=Polyangium aurulentum TaxID=2567896 RepID=UPI0010AE926F|nr:VOC family protein [Polyangium aurulentum]UQA60652.1 VOC family protein [Polyangium aurulentum]
MQTSTASAVSLNVKDVEASRNFFAQHIGFAEKMAADGFVAMARSDVGFHVIFLRQGLSSLQPETLKNAHVDGIILAFVVDDVDAEEARLRAEGVPITTPLQTEPWGERFFQITDPNGIIVQFVQWMTAPEA